MRLSSMCHGSDGLLGYPAPPACWWSQDAQPVCYCYALCGGLCTPYRMAGWVVHSREPGPSTVQTLAVHAPEQGIFSGCAGTECMQHYCASFMEASFIPFAFNWRGSIRCATYSVCVLLWPGPALLFLQGPMDGSRHKGARKPTSFVNLLVFRLPASPAAR